MAPIGVAWPFLAVADNTMHTLPWYFGVAVFIFWVAAAGALAVLFRRRLRARAERRREGGRGSGRSGRPPVRDDRSLESGKDLERG